jgi:hypothetical protein
MYDTTDVILGARCYSRARSRMTLPLPPPYHYRTNQRRRPNMLLKSDSLNRYKLMKSTKEIHYSEIIRWRLQEKMVLNIRLSVPLIPRTTVPGSVSLSAVPRQPPQQSVARRAIQSSIITLGIPSDHELNNVVSKKGKVLVPHGSKSSLIRCFFLEHSLNLTCLIIDLINLNVLNKLTKYIKSVRDRH